MKTIFQSAEERFGNAWHDPYRQYKVVLGTGLTFIAIGLYIYCKGYKAGYDDTLKIVDAVIQEANPTTYFQLCNDLKRFIASAKL